MTVVYRGNVSGSAAKLANQRTVSITGAVSGSSTPWDGSSDVEIATELSLEPFAPVQAAGTGVSQNISLPVSGLLEQDVFVFVDGLRLETSEYTIVGSTLTLSVGDGASIEIIPATSKIAYAYRQPVVTISDATSDLLNVHEGHYIRFTSTSAKTLNVLPNSSESYSLYGEWTIRNAGSNALTIVPGSGVTVNTGFGGTLVVPVGGSVVLKRIDVDQFDLAGQTYTP